MKTGYVSMDSSSNFASETCIYNLPKDFLTQNGIESLEVGLVSCNLGLVGLIASIDEQLWRPHLALRPIDLSHIGRLTLSRHKLVHCH